jgi:hypothetical protein
MPNNSNSLLIDSRLLDRGLGTVEYALNNQLHEIQIFITSGDQIYPVAPTAIVELTIEETQSTWVKQGTLTIFNANDLFDSDGFVFRNDGEDLLRIRIVPRDLPLNGLLSLNIEENRDIWEINHLFSIYNVEDVTPQTSGGSIAKSNKKFKKFYFWDIRYQIMSTKNIEYSTALSLKAPVSRGLRRGLSSEISLTDENRSIPTGIAIHEVIKQSLNNDPILSQTGLEINETKFWDIGSNNIFYTSGAAETSYEDLEYLKKNHTSSVIFDSQVPDMSNFEIVRNKGGIGFFALRPFSRIFSNAGNNNPGEDQLEHFFLHSDVQEQKQGITTYRSPGRPENFSGSRDITLRDHSFITSYEFVDIAPIVNSNDFISYCVNSFDFTRRQFNVEFKNNNYQAAQKIFKDKYISQLFKNRLNGDDNFLLNAPNFSKQTNQTIMPVYNLYGDSENSISRSPSGIFKLIYTGIFQNTCINFTVPGLTLRQSGKFIAIDRPEGSNDTTLDNKLCGQWYVINVIHTISNGAYYNNITAVKIHKYK